VVKRVNGTIKQQAILKEKYTDRQEMENQMNQFLIYYNLYRRHGSLKKELNVKPLYKLFTNDLKLNLLFLSKLPSDLKQN
jgi:hypothetical protein